MKILLFGKNGQVGWELQRTLNIYGEVVALDRFGIDNLCGDLTNLDGIRETIKKVAPNVIVNAAAYTAVDNAEKDNHSAMLINAKAPAIIAYEAALLNAKFIHYSTDYVFDGSGIKPWRESDNVAPLNYYGKSKLEGEFAIQNSNCQYLIFRTSWVYGVSGNNFVKTILRLAEVKDSLSIVSDQIGAPTGADLLADLTAHAIRAMFQTTSFGGLYHVASRGEVSWYDYAKLIISNVNRLDKKIKLKSLIPITSAEYHVPAKRPMNSRLDVSKIEQALGLQMPDWRFGVIRMVEQILG